MLLLLQAADIDVREVRIAAISPGAPLIPARKVLLTSGSYLLPSSTSSSSSSSSFASSSFTSSSSSVLELKSEETTCVVCLKGRVTVDKRSYNKESFTIYGRNGPRTALHLESRCTNSSCRVGYYHGYLSYNGMTVYADNALKNEVLVTSTHTGFDVEYLLELQGKIQISSVTFEAEAKMYNRLHNRNLPMDTMNRRVEIYRKRIADAYFLFIYLEFGQQMEIKNHQVIYGDLDSTILLHKEDMKQKFYERWTKAHKCEAPWCGSHLVFDAGLTPHRPVCGAKLSGVRVFPTAGVTTLIGCSKMPLYNSKYCGDHKASDFPVVSSDKVAPATKQKLYKKRKETAVAKDDVPGDDFYVIEKVEDIKTEKDKKLFKIKWAGFPEEDSTWEEASSVPGFIQKFYEEKSNLNKPLPKPTIKHTKVIGGTEYHYPKWGDEKGGQWLNEDFFKIV